MIDRFIVATYPLPLILAVILCAAVAILALRLYERCRRQWPR